MNRVLDNRIGNAVAAAVCVLVLIVVVACVIGGWAYMLGDILLVPRPCPWLP